MWAHNSQRRKLALGTWNIILLAVKEPELLYKVEWYQVDIVRVTSTHSTGSRTKLLLLLGERPWGRPRTRWRDYISLLV